MAGTRPKGLCSGADRQACPPNKLSYQRYVHPSLVVLRRRRSQSGPTPHHRRPARTPEPRPNAVGGDRVSGLRPRDRPAHDGARRHRPDFVLGALRNASAIGPSIEDVAQRFKPSLLAPTLTVIVIVAVPTRFGKLARALIVLVPVPTWFGDCAGALLVLVELSRRARDQLL